MRADYSILVVDDEEDIRECLRIILEQEGFTVRVAVNGRNALETLHAEGAPELILLDIMMPVLNGWDFLKLLRLDEKFRKIPVIVVSASHRDGVPDGVHAVITKPFDVVDLIAKAKSICSTASFALPASALT